MAVVAPLHDVAVIGAGFGGLGMAVRLGRSGDVSFVVLEKAGDIGGTWRDNTYPGASCDVPSHLYSFSFHPQSWPRRYATQAEILRYLERIVEAHALASHLRFDSPVEAAVFDERSATWRLALAGGEVVAARAVVSAVGQLNRPALPDIPGRERFLGRSWHSARWDHGYDLTGRRVAVIGTGASAIQFVPEIVQKAARVHVFQRTAPYVIPRPDRPYGAVERWLYDHVPLLQRGDRLRVFLTGELLGAALLGSARLRAALEQRWRSFMHAQVDDPALRARCEPGYVLGCKRILFSNDWYATLQRESVELVTDRIVEITRTGVATADGAHREVDAVVYGTGFRATEFLQPMQVTGLGGRDLHEVWCGTPEAYRGIQVSGFPNFFMLYGPNTNLGSNSIIFMLEAQIAYVQGALRAMRRRGLAWLDVRSDVQRDFNRWVETASRRTVWETGCHNWYTTATGRNTNNWPAFPYRYRRLLRRVNLADHESGPCPLPAVGG
ncbi:MAG TPA: NAD(P)/FAD-dependent oxidoreductase [Candidatus Dormibacteraeota bacterium]|nr:NAD(P)/FAD-dependent oxidoreductase [Candidatus Dormibacteraeota bacterium]